MRSMRGECTGKMRSTPMPYDVFRTVNISRLEPPERPSTVPSNTWMRSLSPSTTRTWTRTVSPGLKAGTPLRSCSASTRSIGVMSLHVLSAAAQTVKDDGRGRANGQMVPAVVATDRLEHVVGPAEELAGEPPAGPQDEELGSGLGGKARTEAGEG